MKTIDRLLCRVAMLAGVLCMALAGGCFETVKPAVQANTNCVKDNLTGLMWARAMNMFGNCTWTNAISNCNAVSYGGYTDWRLPNVRELQSLVVTAFGYNNLCNTAGTGHWTSGNPFVGSCGASWTSTPYLGYPNAGYNNAVYIDMIYGGNGNSGSLTESHPVWPCRGP